MKPFSRFSTYFLEVARAGSLRKAADVLHVSASAIDRQILQAEEDMAIALFERLPGGLKLTAAGELLLHDLKRWHKDFQRTRERFDDLQGLKRGHVSIALIDALSEGPVTRAIAQMAEEFPQLRFDIRVLDNAQVAAQVSDADVDLGLLLQPAEHANLELQVLAEIDFGVVMRPDHPLAAQRELRLSGLADVRLIVPAAPLIIHQHTRAIHAAHPGVEVIACNDVRMMRSLIRWGAGVGVLSRLDASHDLEQGQLVFVPLRDRKLQALSLALCIAPRRQLSRAAQMTVQRLGLVVQSIGEGHGHGI